MLIIPQKLLRNLYFYLFIIILITLPYRHTNAINSTCIILCGCIWLLEWQWKIKWKTFINSPLILLFVALYFLYIIGLLYSSNIENGLEVIERLLPLAAFTLIVGLSTSPLTKRQIEIIIWAFVGNNLVCSLICLFNALYFYYFHSSSQYLYHDAFTSTLDITAIYFSVYIGFSMFWLTNYLLKNKVGTIKKILIILLHFYLLGILFLLNIRTALSSLALIYFLGVIIHFYLKKKLLIGILAGGALLILIFTAVYIIPVTREKFFEAINLKDSIQLNDKTDHSLGRHWGGRAIRVAIWQSSLQLTKENILTGVGPGDVQDELQKKYREMDFLFASEYNSYNSHNQLLETQLAIGILGTVILIAIFIYPFLVAIRDKYYLYVGFIVFVAANCMTESFLGRQKGAVFFGLVNALLFFQYFNRNLSTEKDL